MVVEDYVGHVNGSGTQYHYGSSGASGGFNSGYVSVTPGQTYTVTVGAGSGIEIDRATPNGWGEILTAGKSGFVLIAYGGDI